MGWNRNGQQNTWKADDYNRLPALREDNIYQCLVGQDKEEMEACFYNVLTPPMTDEFFANAVRKGDEDEVSLHYALDKTSDGREMSVACRVGVGENAPVELDVMVLCDDEMIYIMRYEWVYRNQHVNKRSIDYGREKYPEVPDTRWDREWMTYLSFGIGGDRGMEEDLISIAWDDVDPVEAETIAQSLYEHTLKDLLGRGNEITNGTVTVRLDEYNMKKMLDKARAMKSQYGANKVVTWMDPRDPSEKVYASYTGDKYCERVEKMVDVAYRVMSGELVPDLLERLPLKKDGTFKQDQTIVIFDGKISDAATYDYYTSGDKMCLGITTGDDYYSENKGAVRVGENTGRLAIITLNTTRKLYPLLNEELEIQDIKTKTRYLKQDEVKLGSVYAEKSGTKYLYVKVDDSRPDCVACSSSFHYYVRYTKKVEQAVKDCETLEELQDVLGDMELTWSCREAPRKFVSWVEEIVSDGTAKEERQ